MQDPDASANVQKAFGLQRELAKSTENQPGRARGAVSGIGGKLARGSDGAEMLIDSFAVTAPGHQWIQRYCPTTLRISCKH